MKTFLHVGCGHLNKSHAKGFDNDDWKEIRFDIDKSVNPDLEGTITDMKRVETSSVDAIYSSHNIEHIFPHQVPIALREFYRVLKDNGIAVILCPDLQSVCKEISQGNLLNTLYTTSSGPIAPIDILYGHRSLLANGNEYMAHKCGFTYPVLNSLLSDAGFQARLGGSRAEDFQISVVAFKIKKSEQELKKIAAPFLPWFKF